MYLRVFRGSRSGIGGFDPKIDRHFAVLVGTLPKFNSNSSPLKSYRNPIGKNRLPTIIFQGRAVKLREGLP